MARVHHTQALDLGVGVVLISSHPAYDYGSAVAKDLLSWNSGFVMHQPEDLG